MASEKSSLKSTIRVSITNFLDSGSIVAGASGLTLWTQQFSSRLIRRLVSQRIWRSAWCSHRWATV